MKLISYQKKLDIQITLLDKIVRFFKWYERRWNAYFTKKEWDKWFDTFIHIRDMSKEDRSLILQILPSEELKEAMYMKGFSQAFAGEMN